ncbi:MFS transporter [Pseudonocardiaceae bacterium YIM PH 21723]|nr:MFS transporter [Pseudonocardiaceae bacterium YIM PH 21723]
MLGSLVGTSLEWYDFFLYATAATLVFPAVFFPQLGEFTAILVSFTTYAVGFVARPLGGMVFGHFGDRIGRRSVLVTTLILMGVSTFLIGLLPGYATLGIAAPILLCLLRFAQGLGLGGEWGGAVLMSIEHGRADRSGLNGSWPQVGVPVGLLLANAVLLLMNLVLPKQAFVDWGWRVGFLLSGVLVLVGLWLRTRVSESPKFAELEATGEKAKLPLAEVFRDHWRELIVAIVARVGTDVGFYTFAFYSTAYLTKTLHVDSSTALRAVLIGAAFQVIAIPLSGLASDLFGRRKVYFTGCLLMAGWAFAFFPLLETRSPLLIVLALVIAFATHAVVYGPQAAFIAEMFSARFRYSGASVGYQMAGIFGGGLAPIIALSLYERYHSSLAISVYVAATLVLAAAATLFARRIVG